MSNKLPYGVINDSLKTIAEKVSATVPEKRYANEKDEIAGTLNAISMADIGGGGSGDVMVVHFTFPQSSGSITADKTYAQILAHAQAGGAVFGVSNDGYQFSLAMFGMGFLAFWGLTWYANQGEGNFTLTLIHISSENFIELKSHDV